MAGAPAGDVEFDGPARERMTGFTARTIDVPRAPATPYRWFRVGPHRPRAWRPADELPGRELMPDGRRLV